MNCEEAQEIISAALDGEATELEEARALRHARDCRDCGEVVSGWDRGGVRQVDDVMTATFPPLPPALRWALWGVAGVCLVAGGPMALGLDVLPIGGASATHLVRDGALAVVLGAILVVAVLRPRWARPMAVLATLAVALQVVGGVTDVATGRVNGGFEAVHVVDVVAVALAWIAAAASRPRLQLPGQGGGSRLLREPPPTPT